MKHLIMIAAMIAAFGLGGAAAVAASSDKPSTPGAAHDKVTICHATGSATNPYVEITVNFNSIQDAKDVKGHIRHGDDIIPPYTYSDSQGTFSFPGQGDQTLLANNCAPGGTPPPTDPGDCVPSPYHPCHTDTDTTHTDTTDTTHTDTTNTTPTDTTNTTPTNTTPTETTGTETTPTETTSTEEKPQVFTPPTSNKPAKNKPAKNKGGTSVAGVVEAPSNAAQAAPLTP